MNRPVRWLWGVVVAVGLGAGAACTVPDLSTLGPFACDDSSSCAPGYTCIAGQCSQQTQTPEQVDSGVPDSGVTDTGGPDSGVPDAGALDTTPPTLTLSVPSPQKQEPVGNTTYIETASDGTPLPTAWRRDQTVAVELRTDSTLPISFTLTGTDGQAVSMNVVPFTDGCDALQCARAQLALWKPRLDAERGTFSYTATARDEAGNTTVRTGSLTVTRFKWAYNVFDATDSNSVEATPAIGSKGTLYVTTYYTTLLALSPDGVLLWSKDNGGEGTAVVGSTADGRETLYVRGYWQTSKSSGAQLYVYTPSTSALGTLLQTCPATRVANLYIESYALYSAGSAAEGVVAPVDGDAAGQFLGLSATGSSGAPICQSLATAFKDGVRGNTVLHNGLLYFTDTDDDATSVTLGSATARTGWPVSSVSPNGVNGMALSGDTLVMGEGDVSKPTSVGGISMVGSDGGNASLKYLGGPVASPVVGQGNVAFGVDGKSGQLVRALLSASGSSIQSQETALDASLSPTLGQGGLVYALFPSEVGVWSASDLSLRWRWSVGSVPDGARRVAPTLDCMRDTSGTPISGMPGVLYATIHSRVYALVVDSAGLDADAPWPKFQHDERNTGNSGVSIQRCP